MNGFEWTVIAAVGFLVAFAYCFWRMMGATTKIFLDLNIQLPYDNNRHPEGERVVFSARDGIDLPGLLIRSPSSQGETVVFAPEFGADMGSYRKYAAHLVEAGFHLFTFEFRGHGPVPVSEGYIPTHWPTRYELSDLLGAIDFVSAQEGVAPDRIALFGVSKGACISICAAAAGKAKAVVADSAFSTRETALSYIERWGPIFLRSELFWRWVPRWFLKLLQRFSMAFSGVLRGCTFISVTDNLKDWNGTPILFIHGERDSFIPHSQATTLAAILPDGVAEAWVVPKARHNESAVVAREEYQRRTAEFFGRHLRETE